MKASTARGGWWRASAVGGAVALASASAAAWGPQGHRLVAGLAESRLSAAARAEAERLLALEPGATLASVSMWADENRTLATGPWHYVNFVRGEACRYDATRVCVEGQCIVGAIERQRAVLASRAPDDERLLALKYLVHLVTDAHQPLHGGFGDDRGGNTVPVELSGLPTNLHAVWDTGLIEQWPGGWSALRDAVAAERVPAAADAGAVAAVEESCRVVATTGFYPDPPAIDADYRDRWSRTLVRRLALAAHRLGQTLEAALRERR